MAPRLSGRPPGGWWLRWPPAAPFGLTLAAGGLMLGAGYDLLVADEWSLGLLARVTAYRLYGVDDSIRLASPSVLLTATFN